jgi:hypothetical protein
MTSVLAICDVCMQEPLLLLIAMASKTHVNSLVCQLCPAHPMNSRYVLVFALALAHGSL